MVDTMGKIIDIVEPLGMKATIEAFATALTPMSTCLKFVEDCKPRYVGMCLDPRQQFRDEKGFDSLKAIGRDRTLIPYVQLNDSALEGSAGVLPGEGFVPLTAYLDALPEDVDISVEAQIPRDNVYTGLEWAKISVERIRKYLVRYEAAKAQRQST